MFDLDENGDPIILDTDTDIVSVTEIIDNQSNINSTKLTIQTTDINLLKKPTKTKTTDILTKSSELDDIIKTVKSKSKSKTKSKSKEVTVNDTLSEQQSEPILKSKKSIKVTLDSKMSISKNIQNELDI